MNTYISKCDIDVIHHLTKSLLFDGSDTCIKKQESLFDVSWGAYDRAELCELVGIHMLNLLSKMYNKNNFGLYRDDGLTVLENKNGLQSEQVKKNIQKTFKEHVLHIITQCNTKIVDVTFNLNDRGYKPYTKSKAKLNTYTKTQKHLPSIIQQIKTIHRIKAIHSIF